MCMAKTAAGMPQGTETHINEWHAPRVLCMSSNWPGQISRGNMLNRADRQSNNRSQRTWQVTSQDPEHGTQAAHTHTTAVSSTPRNCSSCNVAQSQTGCRISAVQFAALNIVCQVLLPVILPGGWLLLPVWGKTPRDSYEQ
jgi:hypothetical protein